MTDFYFFVLLKNWYMHKLQASIYSTIHLTTSLRQHDILQSPAEHPLRAHPAGTSAYHTAYSLSSGFRGIKAHTPKYVKSHFFFSEPLHPLSFHHIRLRFRLKRE